MSKQPRPPRWALTILTVLLGLLLINLAAWQASSKASGNQVTSNQRPAGHVGYLAMAPTHGLIGSEVAVTANRLPAKTSFDLVWQTVKENWVVKGQYGQLFDGRAFQGVSKVLEPVRSDASGHLNATFTVPDGFGFNHTVSLVKGGVMENQALFKVDPQASLMSTEGPVGSPIDITMKGIGAVSYTNSWMLLYDNKFTGWISSVTTNGTAHITIPATGSPGKHIISIVHGAYTFPYLNPEQSPHRKPEFHLVYTIVPGPATLPLPPGHQGEPSPSGREPEGTGPAAWVTPAAGPVQTPLAVHAHKLHPGQVVGVRWSRVVGNRVTATGWSEKTVLLGKSTVAADGTLSYRVDAPDDLGGAHTISLVATGGQVLARTKFTVTPSAVSINPSRGPVGTSFTLHLKGVGWTDTANIYTVVYDNAYIGYACGFNSQGDVIIHLRATGRSGWHFIDLYPSVYQGKDIQGTKDFRLPQLTYASDHPGERLPAFHFAFYDL